MPWNAYATIALGLGVMNLETPSGLGPFHPESREITSRIGWVLDLSAGKEWWIGDDRALGLAAFFLLSAFPEPNPELLPRWGGPAAGLRATATWD
jgi:hypothetical protein